MKSAKRILEYPVLFVLGLLLLMGCRKENSPQHELRAVWIHPGLFSPVETNAGRQIDSLFDSYKEIGINNLFCYNAAPGENSFQWDYLKALITKGHQRGIKIHPIFYPGYEVNLEKEMAKNPSWLIRDMDGKYLPHLNLANPEVRKYWVDKITSTLKYDIDGIHLDYIRFPITQVYSYDSVTCSEFKREFDYSPLEVSHDCGSMIWCEWIKWNARQVTSLVTEIRAALKESGKPVVLGVDVFPDLETSKVLIGQDWGDWAEKGLVDFICPMLYTNNLVLFKEYIQRAIKISGNRCAVYPGIGVFTAHNKITKDLITREVVISRKLGTGGMVFFSGYSFNKEMRDTLKSSLF
jgi:uncharacterized lipoprotein YddW (UPF0748 family)